MADVQRLRADLGYFAHEIGCPLAGWQVESLRLEAPTTVIVGPRQAGKSRSLAVLALWWAFRLPEQHVLVISAGESAAHRLLREARLIALASPLLADALVLETAGLLRLDTGSEILSTPASEKQVRGNTIDLLICDEAMLVSDELLNDAAYPTIAARPDARVVLAGTASVAAGVFFDQFQRGQQGSETVRSFRWSLEDCEWISPSFIEDARGRMSAPKFAAEFLGDFSAGGDMLFSRKAIERVTADFRLTPLSDLQGPARVSAGVDWGGVRDRSVFAAIARVPEAGAHRFAVVCTRRWEAGAALTAPGGVVDEILSSPAHIHRLSAERNGLGFEPCARLLEQWADRPRTMGGAGQRRGATLMEAAEAIELMDRLERRRRRQAEAPPRFNPGRGGGPFETTRVAIDTSASLKSSVYSTLVMLVDREALLIPADAHDLLRELLLLRVELTATGLERIAASSDDVCDAVCFALGPTRVDGQWKSLIGELVKGDATVDGLQRLPVREEEPVKTGGGVELPRDPVIQSVNGPERTMPPGYSLIDPKNVYLPVA